MSEYRRRRQRARSPGPIGVQQILQLDQAGPLKTVRRQRHPKGGVNQAIGGFEGGRGVERPQLAPAKVVEETSRFHPSPYVVAFGACGHRALGYQHYGFTNARFNAMVMG